MRRKLGVADNINQRTQKEKKQKNQGSDRTHPWF